jgi:hypothetical protein
MPATWATHPAQFGHKPSVGLTFQFLLMVRMVIALNGW